nr:hypothetical protein [Tanacetum cinerariifolium]
MTNYSLWEVILNGYSPIPTRVIEGVVQPVTPTTVEQRLAKKNELKARGTLLMALPDKHQLKFNIHNDAKTLIEAIEKRFGGNKKAKKFLRSLPTEWKTHTLIWRNKTDLEDQSLDDFTNESVSAVASVSAASAKVPVSALPNMDTLGNAFIYSFFASQSNSSQLDNDDLKQIDADDLEEMDLKWQMAMLTVRARRFLQRTKRNLEANRTTSMGFDMSKVECYNYYRKRHFAREYSVMVWAAMTGAFRQKKNQPTIPLWLSPPQVLPVLIMSYDSDISMPASLVYDRYQSGEGYHAVPPPYTGTFMPPKPDLVFHDAPNVNETIHTAFNVKLSPTKPDKDLSHSPSASIIEDWVSDLEDNSEADPLQNDPSFVPPTKQVKTPKPSVKPVKHSILAANYKTAIPKPKPYGNSRNRKACFVRKSLTHLIKDCDYYEKQMHALKDKRVIDSGCSRHITRNMSYLSNFEEINGGYVAFGGNPKGGKITSKGKIRTGKLDFDDVYFVKELKFNLFSVSHMCDKKNSVLFIDTECIVLSPEFKLPNENQVLLRVPRENNMYNVDLKNIVPSGDLTCLFAKATLDEYNLWHRRLGHINFKTINKLVKDLYNWHRKPIKSQGENNQSDNGTEFKNQDLNQFYGMKRIKIEFSVPRTPQQNGIAERKNMTHIEAARTMLADLLLHIPFWSEAVSNACYVQNRVLVTKPHNKTPYELLFGRTPSIGFMRPFGCLVTILNSLDPLGKFDGKADEGFLVGYFVSSKAFRVFNSRTQIIQETLLISFLENKPNVTGSGPTWLFDIYTLTKSMNYQPVTAGNQPNPSANPQNTDGDATFKVKEPEFEVEKPESEVHVSSIRSAKTKKHDDKTKREAKGKSPVELSTVFRDLRKEFEDFSDNSINKVNAAGTQVPAVRQILTNTTNTFSAAGPSNTAVSPTHGKSSYVDPSQYLDDPNILALEDINYSDEEEDVGAKADFTNLETTITISHIPTTRVHKDHHVTQIIGDLSSATQTRSMTRMVKDQEEPNRVHQALKDLIWIEAMQEELLQFKMQKEEGIDYEEVFTPVARIEAIRLFLAYASFMGFMVYQMDVKSAFLYGTIEEEVYVCQPPGVEDLDHPDKRGKIDQTLFIKKQKGDILLVQVYVDDIIFGSSNKDLCKAFEKLIKDKFQISSMGELIFFLGLQIKQKPNGIFLIQDKYAAEILRKFGLSDGKSASTPIYTKKPLLKDLDREDVDVHTYRSMISSLMYLTSSRPDIMFIVCMCSFPMAYSDSDYAGASLDRMSTTGSCQFFRCRLISWQCKKQTVVATSSTEAEYVAAASCYAQVLCIQNQLMDHGKKVIITEATVQEALRLDDAESIDYLPNKDIFTELSRMGVRLLRGQHGMSSVLPWLQLSSAFQQVENLIFPIGDLSSHTTKYSSSALTQKVFANTRRVGKGFFAVETPLFKGMLVPQQAADVDDVVTNDVAADDVPAADAEPTPPHHHHHKNYLPHHIRVKNLEQDKIAQALEITKLKQRVKRLEKKNKLKVSGLKRLRKDVAAVAKEVDVEKNDVVEKNVDVQGRQEESQAKVYHIDLENADKVLSMQYDEPEPVELQEVIEVVTTTKLMTEVVTVVTTPITAATITAAPSAARRRKEVVIRDPKETATSSTIIHSELKSKDKGKGIMVQRKEKEDNAVLRYQALKRKPQTEAQARKNMIVYLKNMAGFKMNYFKGMSYDAIRLIFKKYFNLNVAFLEKSKEELEEEESRALKRKTESSKEKAAKKQNYTDDLAGREKISIDKTYCCWCKLKLLDDAADIKLRLLEQSAVETQNHSSRQNLLLIILTVDLKSKILPPMRIKGILKVAMGWFLGCDQALDYKGGGEDNERCGDTVRWWESV